jgi:hypothetical protein
MMIIIIVCLFRVSGDGVVLWDGVWVYGSFILLFLVLFIPFLPEYIR